MSILDLNLNDPELQLSNIPTGEQKLRITKAEVTKTKAGKDCIKVSMNLDEGGNHWPISQYFVLEADTEEKLLTLRRMLAEFCSAFQVPIKKNGSLDTEAMVGCTCWCIITEEEYEGRLSSKIDKYVRTAQ